MTHLILFLAAFSMVFLLGFQQKNVQGHHYLLAVVTSLAIGISQIFLWRLIPTAAGSEIIATLAGGPLGIVSAMYIHPRLMKGKPRA